MRILQTFLHLRPTFSAVASVNIFKQKALRYKNFYTQVSYFSCERNNFNKNVYIETYGCQMNFNDSGIALSILLDNGYKRVDSITEANVVLLMTCAIREGAETKIWNRLQQIRGSTRNNKSLTVGVLGCMAERLKQKILDYKYRVDVVCGPDAYRDLPRLLEQASTGHRGMNVALSLEETYAEVAPVRVASSTDLPSAFVSVMRGCDNMCTYCIVPFTRGRERSRPLASIVDEVTRLSEQGIREVVLLGQNVNSYRDLSEGSINTETTSVSEGFRTVYKPKLGGRRFGELLHAVSCVDSNMRIRFTSPHPKDFPDDVLHLIKERPNICNQVHLPAQSGSSNVLNRMARGYTREVYLTLAQKARSIIPGLGLSSDFISGFCGETDSEHEETLTLMREVRYNFAFCFPYSMREKTRAFHRLVDDVPQEVKSSRHMELIAEFRRGALELNEAQIGQVQLLLVEGSSKRSLEELAGRNEVNTKVIFPKEPVLFKGDDIGDEGSSEVPRSGDYVAVKIVGANSQTLRGIPLYRSNIDNFYSDCEKNETRESIFN